MDALDDNTAWVLTSNALLTTTDDGTTWTELAAADVSGARAFRAIDAQHLAIAALDGPDSSEAVVRTTSDAGQHWQDHPLATSGQPGDIRLAGASSLLVVLVVQTTSANSSIADAFVSQSGGAFEARSAPAAGTLSITSAEQIWLAGGVLGNQLWRSSDAVSSWSEIQIASLLGTDIGLSAPQRVAGTLLLPVTINASPTKEAWLKSDDEGMTWQQLAVISVGGDTGTGTALAASHAGDGLVVAGSGGQLFSVTSAGQAATPVSPNGLPLGVTTLDFTSATHGWAIDVQRGCTSGKTQCYEASGLFATADGGQTWIRIKLPA